MARNLDTMTVPTPRLDELLRPELLRPSVFVAPIDEVPLYGGARARRLARRRSIRRAISAVLCLLLAAGAVFVMTQRNATTTVSLDEAVKAFRHDGRDGVDAPAERLPVGSAIAKAAAPDTVATSAQAKDPRGTIEAATPVKVVPYALPDEGVYAYRTKGGESVSMFGASHTYPDRIFATVRHLGGCRWEHRSQVIEEHTDIRTFCGARGSLAQLSQERQVTFFGKRDGAKLSCAPALTFHETSERPGDSSKSFCTDGKSTNATLVAKFLGLETMTIGGDAVRSVHVQVTGVMSGRVSGTSTDDLWLAPDTGLTLRWDRTVDTLAKAFGNAKVRYKEDASFLLESLEPQR